MSKKTKETGPETELQRRSFLNIVWTFLGALALAEFIVAAFAFLRPRKLRAQAEKADSIVSAGAVESFEPNSVTAFVRGKFYLARLEDGGFMALSRTCTHLGCSVPWVEKEMKFACPCHGSVFDITGRCHRCAGPTGAGYLSNINREPDGQGGHPQTDQAQRVSINQVTFTRRKKSECINYLR